MNNLLTEKNRQQLEAAYDVAKDKRTANKINAVLLKDDGFEQIEIANILRINQSTVARQLKSYSTNGLTTFLENPYIGGHCHLEDQQLEKLENYLEEVLCGSTDEVIEYVKSEFDVSYTQSGMSALLRRLGFVFKKPVLVPGKGDSELQEAFIEYYKRIKECMGPNDKIYFLDGVHPQHNTIASGGWIRKGKEKQLASNTGRNRVNLNGALDADTHEVIIRADDTINAQSTIKLLKMIEKANLDAAKIVLFVDRATYYYNAEVIGYVQDSRQFEIVHLPTYSPNLNLIERVWRFMKKKVLYNRYHETFEEFKTTIGNFFQELPKYYDELEEILTEEFQVIKS